MSYQFAETTLGSVSEYITSGSRDWSKYYADTGAIFIRTQDINKNRLSLDNVSYVKLPEKVEGKRSLVKKGDLLITITGANVGKVALVDHEIPEAYVSQSVCLVRLKDPSVAKFLQLQLIAKQGDKSPLEAMAYGLGRPVLNLENVRSAPVKLAEPSVRNDIVSEIEKQFSRLDEAVTGLKRVKANLKRYKAAILKAAVEGRLVETEADLARREGRSEGRSYETGAQLLQRILETRRSQWQGKGKYKEPAAPDTANLPKLPEGWASASLEALSWDSAYGTSEKCSYENSGPAVLRIPNVQHGMLDLSDLKFASPTFVLPVDAALTVSDMLIIRTNGSKSLIGKAAVVLASPTKALSYASYLIRFRLTRMGSLPDWVSVVWQTPQIRSWIEAHAATSAGQHNVSMTTLATAAVPLPPLSEQHRIVAEVDRLLSIAREAEVEVETNLKRAQALRQACLSSAFGQTSKEIAP